MGTLVFAVTAGSAAVAPLAFDVAALVVALGLFFVGTALFLWAFALAVSRSRASDIGLAGLFYLSGSAPSSIRHNLLGSLSAEVVVALVTATARPFSSLAFGVLAPVYGLSLCGLWAARHGSFPLRPRPRG
jgi:hypothetical protein